MAVTAKFVPERIDLLPNVPATVTLRLYNGDDEVRSVSLTATGDLVGFVTLDVVAAHLETNQIVDVTVTIEAPSTLEAGPHGVNVEVAPATVDGAQPIQRAGDGGPTTAVVEPAVVVETAVVVASLVIDVVAHCDYAIELRPSLSRGSSAGRHRLHIVNTGNIAIALDVVTDDVTDGAIAEVAQTSLAVEPGASTHVAVRVVPNTTFWSGPAQTYDFLVRTTSTDGRVDEHIGTYEQRPLVPSWIGPAAAGALAALVVGAIIWFSFLRPWVQDTADDAARTAIERDRAALQLRIDDLEAAARDAKELPLGTPTDIRLDVAPASGSSDEAMAGIESGTRLSITDVVLENPTGAVGLVTLRRGADVILQSELANFRDFDRHFVAPFVFDGNDQIVLAVECRTPGPGGSDCPVGASLVGFVDQAD